MGKKHKHLFEQVVDINNIRLAYNKAVRGGNRYTISHLKFKENLEANLHLLQQSLINGTYKRGAYHTFSVYEPKERLISALPFRDRVVQHCLNNILQPIFEKLFYYGSYACRPNKGVHNGVKDVQATIRRLAKQGNVYYLKMDFSKYFHSIDKEILFKEVEKKITDKKVLKVLKDFDGCTGAGIPIGNLLSQLFANIYGNIFDRFIKTKIKAKHYFRYMDDTVIISNSKKELVLIQKKLKIFARLFMKLKFSKWFIESISKPLNFLGYRITPKYKLIRKDSVVRAKRKIKRYKRYNNQEKLKMFLASWLGHLKSADSYNLKKYIQKEFRLWQMRLT
jgi:retron-type reverse transcriptase